MLYGHCVIEPVASLFPNIKTRAVVTCVVLTITKSIIHVLLGLVLPTRMQFLRGLIAGISSLRAATGLAAIKYPKTQYPLQPEV